MNEVYEMNEILTTFGSFIVGIIVGFTIYHFAIGKSKAGTQQKEIDKTKSELEEYKAKVNSHFTNTAALMGEVASSYQSLYKHMADQSEDLLSDADLTPFPLLEKTPIENEDVAEEDNSEQAIASAEDADKQDEETQVNESDSVSPEPEDAEQSDNKKTAEVSDDVKEDSESTVEATADNNEEKADSESAKEDIDSSKDESAKKTV